MTAHCRYCRGGGGREDRLDENLGSVGILCSFWQSVRVESYIVIVSWVEQIIFVDLNIYLPLKNLGLAKWNFHRKQLPDSVFPALIHFPRRKWYPLLKTSPRPGTRKEPEPVAINLTTWKNFNMLYHFWLLTWGFWTPRAVVLKLFGFWAPLS